MSELKLLPCPFCGGEAKLKTARESDGQISYGSIYVACLDCRSTGLSYTTYYNVSSNPEEEAIAAWNRRAGKDINVATNADRIRSMSDEELAREMLFFVPSDFNRHYTGIAGGYYATADEAIQANFDWLKQPAKEELI